MEVECPDCGGEGVGWRCCNTPKQCDTCPRPTPCRRCWGAGTVLKIELPLDTEPF